MEPPASPPPDTNKDNAPPSPVGVSDSSMPEIKQPGESPSVIDQTTEMSPQLDNFSLPTTQVETPLPNPNQPEQNGNFTTPEVGTLPVQDQMPPTTTPPMQPEVIPQQLQPPVAQAMSSTADQPKANKFKFAILAFAIITLIIYAAVFFLFLSNRNLENTAKEEETSQNTPPAEVAVFNPDQVQIVNGSIYRVVSPSNQTPLVLKESYTSTGITGFATVKVSPDNQKLCFEAWPPAPEPAMYVSNVDGSEVVEVAPGRRGCHWSADSAKLAYVNHTTDVSAVDIYLYDVQSATETNLTAGKSPEDTIRYYVVSDWAGATTLLCSFTEEIQSTPGEERTAECQINTITGEITETPSAS